MRRLEWRVWIWFAGCFLLLLGILGWLTMHALRLEQARIAALEELSQGRLALAIEERVHSAFWRIDSLMSLLVARESARSPAEYQLLDPGQQPAEPSPEQQSRQPDPQRVSPILATPSDFVRLHFQVEPDGRILSPQAPEGPGRDLAVACGISPQQLEQSGQVLKEARLMAQYTALIGQCAPMEQSPAEGLQPWIQEQNRPGPLGNRVGEEQYFPIWAKREEWEAVGDHQTAGPEAGMAASDQTRLSEYMSQRSNRETASRAKISQSQLANVAQGNLFPAFDQSAADGVGAQAVGMMRPVWLSQDQLMLVRKVAYPDRTVIQCCWLDWPRLREYLMGEIADLFTRAELVPVTNPDSADLSRTSAILPVELHLHEGLSEELQGPLEQSDAGGGVWPALAGAWVATGLAVLAMAVLLAGVLRLSARRAVFVSAVSHELRTPLTTFRMYSEMLADGVITEPQQQASYLQTLRTEAERLGHLVDNVLEYAGLEHRVQRSSRQTLVVGDLIQRVRPSLVALAEQAGIPWQEEFQPEALGLGVRTDPSAVERVLVNLVDNAVKYGQDGERKGVSLSVVSDSAERVRIEIRDFGRGVSRQQQRRMFQAFSRSDEDSAGGTPGVGLGLSLCKKIARELGGNLRFEAGEPGSRFQLVLGAVPPPAGSESTRET